MTPFEIMAAGLVIVALLFTFAQWGVTLIEQAQDAKRLDTIQGRLRGIHDQLSHSEETTMYDRQILFTEMYDLLEERQDILANISA